MQDNSKMRLYGAALILGLVLPTAGLAVAPEAPEKSACLTDTQKEFVGLDVDAVQDQLPERARIIPPESAVTQDFRPDRVNVDIDEDGIVTGVWCG